MVDDVTVSTSANPRFDAALRQAMEVVMPESDSGFRFVATQEYDAEISRGYHAVALEAERANAQGQLAAQLDTLRAVSPELAAELEKQISQIAGASNIQEVRKLKAELSAAIKEASSFATSDRSINDWEDRESMKDKMEKLQLHIADLTKKISKGFDAMEENGVVFEDADKKRMQELNLLLANDPGNKEANAERDRLTTKMNTEAERQANDPDSHVTDRDGVRKEAEKNRKLQEEREAYTTEREALKPLQESKQGVLSSAPDEKNNTAISANDDPFGEMAGASQTSPKQGADVSMKDVALQSIGKKSGGRVLG